MPQGEAVLCLDGVSRHFGHRPILTQISFTAEGGDAILLIGKNGAGKTTLLRLVAGLLRPSAGRIDRCGAVGMVAHHTMLYDSLTARENLAFFARLHGGTAPARVDALLQQVGLAGAAQQRIGTFSRGMLQRLSIARALLHEPEILLLDEPLSGLDDAGTRMVLDLLEALRVGGRLILVATHQIAELTPLASRVGYLVQGRLAALEPVTDRRADAVLDRYRRLVTSRA